LRAVGVDLEEGNAPRQQEPLAATLLAYAGLKRLGLAQYATQVLDVDLFLPAPAQGVVGIEIRSNDRRVRELLAPLDHAPSRELATAERCFVRALEGGCRVPIGALAERHGAVLRLSAFVGRIDGTQALRAHAQGYDAEALGLDLAQSMREQGAARIVAAVRAQME
jgi:hydroxymethylbilane synthase